MIGILPLLCKSHTICNHFAKTSPQHSILATNEIDKTLMLQKSRYLKISMNQKEKIWIRYWNVEEESENEMKQKITPSTHLMRSIFSGTRSVSNFVVNSWVSYRYYRHYCPKNWNHFREFMIIVIVGNLSLKKMLLVWVEWQIISILMNYATNSSELKKNDFLRKRVP